MYQSPGVARLFSRENMDTVLKKPGATDTSSRHPLQDRAVNPSSPKGAPNRLKRPQLTTVRPSSPAKENFDDDDLFIYDSYADKDFNGNELETGFLKPKDMYKILRSYCGYETLKTPPPEIPIKFETIEHSEVERPDISDAWNQLQETYSSDSWFHFGEESIDDVPLPCFD